MNKFDETRRYMDVLFETIFNPQLRLNKDFEKSYTDINERVELLESLDYDLLKIESFDPNAKSFLIDNIRRKNIFRDNPSYIKDAMLNLVRTFKDGAISLERNGIWNEEQLKFYRFRLTDFVYGIEKRLNEFVELYRDFFIHENPESLNIRVINNQFKEELYKLMIEIPIIEPTEKDNLFYALFGENLNKTFEPIKIANRKGDLFYYLIYKLTGHAPDGNTVPNKKIRKNILPLFGIKNDEKRMPTLSRYPSDFGEIDNLFKNFPPNKEGY